MLISPVLSDMHDLSEAFKKRFDIVKVLRSFSGGQKMVYIVECTDGSIKAAKIFRNCSVRDIQEIDILKRYSEATGISNILSTEDFDGSMVLFEEFIDAPDLEDTMAEYAGDHLKISQLLSKITSILEPVWNDRIVHRDLKPTNIKVLSTSDPVIMDFGIARDLSAESITQTGDDQPMSWPYASPEQYNGDKTAISYRSDFFSLGVIAYRLYYQKLPFGNSKDEVAAKIKSKDNEIQSDPDCQLNPFFESTLSFDISARPKDVATFKRLLP